MGLEINATCDDAEQTEAKPAMRLGALPARWALSAMLLTVLMIFAGAGFASGRMWDGRNTDMLDLMSASGIAEDTSTRSDLRINAVGKLGDYAEDAIVILTRLEADPEIGPSVKIFADRLRSKLGK